MSTLGDRLRELRGTTSQSKMARELGMARPQWIRYENGTSIPGSDILEKICRIHACSADWLLGLKDNGGVNVKADNGAAVAVGSHARATSKLSTTNSSTPNCSKCPYKLKWEKMEKLMAK